MPLPKIVTPSYELTLPSNRKKIKYRPFLVKEEKILILAIEGGNMKDITTAIKDVLANCVLTKGVNIEELPTFDIEYLFLNIRSRSVGESIDLIITCPDDGKTKVNSTIYIDEIKVKKPKDHKKDIKIDDTYTMRLKYPTLDQFIESNFSLDKEDDTSFDIVASCMDMVFSEDEAWEAKDSTKEELISFLEQLNSTQFREIETFFDTMPKLSHEIEVENPDTKVKSTVKLEGLANFFA
tara:strand:- start:4440 stop:5153 length:714 start_codon:yes stop_codon:yes gene_type:complete